MSDLPVTPAESLSRVLDSLLGCLRPRSGGFLRIYGHLTHLATNPGEICGLTVAPIWLNKSQQSSDTSINEAKASYVLLIKSKSDVKLYSQNCDFHLKCETMATVLLVDDSTFQRDRVAKLLTSGGHQVFEAPNGQIGLERAQQTAFDIIVLDLLMPELDGFGFLEGLKQHNISTPAVVLTADIQESQRARCIELGAACFLNKPPKSEVLLKTIDTVLAQNKNRDECGSPRFLTAIQQDILTEIINIGVGKAASVLNEMVTSHVTLHIPQVKVLSRGDALREISPSGDGNFISVRLGFNGGLSGSASLVFPVINAKCLVQLLINEKEEDAELNSVQESTLTEVGNIVLNGVMGSIGNCCRETLSYRIPIYTQGSLESALGMSSDSASDARCIVANTVFKVKEHSIEGEMILFFEVIAFQNLLALLEQRL